ncbi:hypothetical protein [Synechococcus sp. RedBA-s]|uniref:hypothetical protein n=1 Tax=Synechococcus sp. RedBA-s TaxID=2823741 RepID=UPI0020CE2FDC|nr:hypothetical protein [Synechococcus sp. RedBA-s]MCP9799886.1 hypothetical protein [Synechococcus sp. RedBA-s]
MQKTTLQPSNALTSFYLSSNQQEILMTAKKCVLLVGLRPELIDFSDPAYAAFPGLDGAKVTAALTADQLSLNTMGYDAKLCLTDFGETAEAVIREKLSEKDYDCILIGAGVRTIAPNFLLFEKLINIIHEHAPAARICFNTKPSDTAEAVKRWI